MVTNSSFISILQDKCDIPARYVLEKMNSDELIENALAVEALSYHMSRICPSIAPHKCYKFIVSYYVKCVQIAPSSNEYLHSRYEAAHGLQNLFLHWHNIGDREGRISMLVTLVANAYLAGNKDVKLAIETGFLEHVLEKKESLIHFQCWKNSKVLQEAIFRSLEWGEGNTEIAEGDWFDRD